MFESKMFWGKQGDQAQTATWKRQKQGNVSLTQTAPLLYKQDHIYGIQMVFFS